MTYGTKTHAIRYQVCLFHSTHVGYLKYRLSFILNLLLIDLDITLHHARILGIGVLECIYAGSAEVDELR